MPGTKVFRRTKAFEKKRELRRKVIAMEREMMANRGKLETANEKAQQVKDLEEEVTSLKATLATVVNILPPATRKKVPDEVKGMLGIKEK